MRQAHRDARQRDARQDPQPPQRLQWLALVAVGAFVVLTALHAGNAPVWTAFDDVGEAIAAAIATLACAIRARREHSVYASVLEMQRLGSAEETAVRLQRQAQAAWLLLTAGAGAWTIGQIGWCVYEVGFGIVPQAPSPLDGAFLLSPVLVVLGLLAMVRTPAGLLSHVRGAVEGLFIACGFFLCSWLLVIGSVLAHSHTTTLGGLVNLAYPVLDTIALSATFFVALQRRRNPPAGLGLLALGIVAVAISDSSFWYLSEINPLFPGVSPLDSGWVAGFLLIALAALRSGKARRWRRKPTNGRLAPALPALPATIGILTTPAVWLLRGGVGSQGTLLGIMAVVALLGVVLLALVTYENRALTSKLERRVEESTAELHVSELRRQAFHDPLTDLPNRTLLRDRATQAFARSQRTGASIAVMAVDLDGFKLVNDGFGHQTGDALLRTVAQRLQTAMRPQDTVARLGGDEFVVLMDAITDADDALAFAERIREALSAELVIEGSEHSITASIGIAVGAAPHTNFDQLLCDADVALYAVKGTGKNSAQLFEPSMHQQARRRFQLQTDLRKALNREEFWLLYQPEFDADGERLEGFEALVRWNHPQHGPMPPDRFIPLAEETGLIVPLGRWVLAQALRQAAEWNRTDAAERPLSIAVNVSAVQLGAPSLLDDVRSALAESGIDPRCVVLEITESSFIDGSERIIDILHALKALGVRLAIDDFGTGYASVSYLQNMPVDILKVDRSFVASSDDEGRNRDLLEAIVNIGRVLSLVTVAEGIEQPSQLATVKRAGCDLTQGYLLGRPLPTEEAQRVIVAQTTTPPRPLLQTAPVSASMSLPRTGASLP